MVENLLERGCPLDVRDRAGNLPWHFAVHGKAVDLVTYLLDRGCPLDAVNDSGQNALHFAAETGAVLGMPCFSTVHAAHQRCACCLAPLPHEVSKAAARSDRPPVSNNQCPLLTP